MTKNEDVSWIPKPVRCVCRRDCQNNCNSWVERMTDEKICPFMSKPGTQMHTIGLVDSVYCQKDRCMAWEPHPKVDEYDTFEGGRCRLIP